MYAPLGKVNRGDTAAESPDPMMTSYMSVSPPVSPDSTHLASLSPWVLPASPSGAITTVIFYLRRLACVSKPSCDFSFHYILFVLMGTGAPSTARHIAVVTQHLIAFGISVPAQPPIYSVAST